MSPFDNETDTELNPRFEWETISGKSRIYLSVIDDFSGVVPITVLGSHWLPPVPLQYKTDYFWKVIPFNEAGEAIGEHKVWTFRTVCFTSENEETIRPLVTGLFSNFPNPFNPYTTIRFSIATEVFRRGIPPQNTGVTTAPSSHASAHVTIDIFNIRGQRVRELTSKLWTAGHHSVVWDGRDDAGNNVSSGIYLYRMTATRSDELHPSFVETRRMVLLR
jgi:hypothetical protein